MTGTSRCVVRESIARDDSPRADVVIDEAVIGAPVAVMGVHVGTSGWSYAHWDGVLYPPATPARDRLGHYVRRFDTVELNASFTAGRGR